VAGLIDRSLVVRADTSVTTRPLYQMLETVRAYAAQPERHQANRGATSAEKDVNGTNR
jgi:hypothetical protein